MTHKINPIDILEQTRNSIAAKSDRNLVSRNGKYLLEMGENKIEFGASCDDEAFRLARCMAPEGYVLYKLQVIRVEAVA